MQTFFAVYYLHNGRGIGLLSLGIVGLALTGIVLTRPRKVLWVDWDSVARWQHHPWREYQQTPKLDAFWQGALQDARKALMIGAHRQGGPTVKQMLGPGYSKSWEPYTSRVSGPAEQLALLYAMKTTTQPQGRLVTLPPGAEVGYTYVDPIQALLPEGCNHIIEQRRLLSTFATRYMHDGEYTVIPDRLSYSAYTDGVTEAEDVLRGWFQSVCLTPEQRDWELTCGEPEVSEDWWPE